MDRLDQLLIHNRLRTPQALDKRILCKAHEILDASRSQRVSAKNKTPIFTCVVVILGVAVVIGLAWLLGDESATKKRESNDQHQTKQNPEPAQHDSPQAVYNAAKAATETKEYNAICDCLTPESRDVVAGVMIRVASDMVDVAARDRDLMSFAENKPPWEASCRVLEDVLAKHGVKEDQLKSIQDMDPAASQEDTMAALAKLGAPIKDKPAFMGEIKNAMRAMLLAYMGKQGGMANNKTIIILEGRLENINVEGDHATARVVVTHNGKEMRESIGFKKVNGSWLIDLMALGRK